MNVTILSRKDLVEGIKTKKLNEENNAIVIVEPNMDKNEKEKLYTLVKNYFKNFIMVSFWDIEVPISNYNIISESTAIFLAKFIENAQGDFIVSCAAGMSRSAGVAKAISVIKEHNGKFNKIQNNKQFFPNKSVEEKIIQAFNKIKKANKKDLTQINEDNLLDLKEVFLNYEENGELIFKKSQYELFLKVLDLYITLHLGRLEELKRINSPISELFEEDDLLEIKHKYLDKEYIQSLGISNENVPMRAKIAYDIYQIFKCKFAWFYGYKDICIDRPLLFSKKVDIDFNLDYCEENFTNKAPLSKNREVTLCLYRIKHLKKHINFILNIIEFILNINEKGIDFLKRYFEDLRFKIENNLKIKNI